jgi:quercetin dioxygenase-like cupin family protein
MRIGKAERVAAIAVKAQGARGVKIRRLIGKDAAAPNFYMRLFTVARGGCTPLHSHDWEHEVYILAGRGDIVGAAGRHKVSGGDFVYVAPGEVHQFANSGDSSLEFLCLVPTTAT